MMRGERQCLPIYMELSALVAVIDGTLTLPLDLGGTKALFFQMCVVAAFVVVYTETTLLL